MHKRYQLHITGVVQGVGFRPFIFRLAAQHHLSGWVSNGSDGVRIEVQGCEDRLKNFSNAIRKSAPPLARIDQLTCREIVRDRKSVV